MVKNYNWCTINKGTSAIKKVEQGVQIEELISIYEEALKLQHKGKLEEAKEKYEQLIDHKFLKKEAKARKNTKEDDKDDNSSPLLTLFFVVSKNYASVLEEEYNRNQDIDSAREALKYYLQAIEMDPTAYSIWYHVGCLSHSLKNLRFARLAYENGIFTNEETRKKSVLDVIRSGRFTPIQWNCFEGLCKVLCDIGDYFTCQHYIENTLKEQSEWTLGKTLLERMKEDPMTDLMDVDEQATSIEPVEITIEKSDLSMLMEKLLALYRKQHTANNLEDEIAEESLESNIEINNTMFINNAVKISIEKDEVPVVEAVQEEPHPQPSSEVLLPSSNIMPFTMIDHQISTEGETLAQDESEKSQKRKREDVVDAVTGEDEESDQEDTKKANLRASRRKKEKFLNTEASRMKMLQEEKQFDLKIQEFYDSLNTIPNLYKNRPWHEPQQTSIIVPPHFWDWFDIKINELESTYSWDMDGKRSDLDSLEHNSKGKGLTMFAMNYSINSTNDQSSSNLTKKIISNLNADNSGVVDVLCKLVITTVKEDMYLDKETSFMSNNLLELLTDTINSLEANFINHLAYLNTHEKALATLRICEYFIDRLIRAIMIATQEAGSHIGFSASYKKKASNMLSKQSKVKQIESLMETAKLWTNLAERHLFDISSTLFESNKNNPETSATLSQDEQKFQLRYYNILGKLAQCQDDIQNASRYYEKCKSILELNPSLKEINIKSMYDSFIDLKSMYNKLSLLRIGNLLVQAKDKSDVGDFPTVIEVIKPIVESKLNTGDPIESDETIQMIVLLAKAYTRAEQHTEAWNCYKQIFCSLVKQMVEYGSSQFQSKSILCKDEDVIFSKIGKHLGDVMDDLLTLIEDPESEKWLPKEADKNFIDILTIVLRMTVYYIFRHPDFVPLVNNFSSPDSIPHTPSRITKANRFNAIVIKSWIIHSHLIKRELRAQTRKTQKIMFDWVKLLQEFHDELGEREICCTSNDVFLHHLLNNLIEIDSEAFRKDIYQCYHCIYGVHLGAEADMIEEHYCTHVKMDQKAAERLFKLVVKAAVVKLQSGALLKGDLKDVIDAVSDLFEQLPEKQIIVDSNKKVIEDYMNSDLNLSSSINSIYRKTLIPILPVDRKKNNISFVYYKIFWIRGKTLRLQIRNRTKTSNEKNMTDLETAIEEFTSHLILNPDDGNAWYDLGVCYHQLADEELNWSASNIKSHKKDIADYQKKAFHAILRAIYLGGLSKDVSQRNEMFTQIGNLLYSMATPPMDMLAFEPETVNNYMDAGGNLISVKNGIPDSKPIYKLAVAMYIHALRYKSLQKSQWRCYYATGKCFAKIGRPPTEVLGWYMHAIQDSRQDRGQKELLIEPVYILCSSLAKYLFQGKISATLVMEYLAKEKSLQIGENSTEENVNDHPKQHAGDEDLIQNGTEHLPADVALAYKGIFKRLLEIISIDIKGWHHRPIYRIAWMQYYIFRNPERAKAELMKLFTLKPTVKSHISIWKPNYELPGKHYVYIHKYTSFLIKLVKETRDENTLEQLSRKLRKVQTLLLNYEQIMNELTVSEQTEQNKQVQ